MSRWGNTVPMLWLAPGTKSLGQGSENIMFWLKITNKVATNMAGNNTGATLKIVETVLN